MEGREKWVDTLGRGAGIGLNIDTPDGGIEVECLERSIATKDFELVYPLVTTVVSGIWETL
jgi:hypothetical protein